MKAKDFLDDYAVDDFHIYGRHEEHYSLPDLLEEYASIRETKLYSRIEEREELIGKLIRDNKHLEKEIKALRVAQALKK